MWLGTRQGSRTDRRAGDDRGYLGTDKAFEHALGAFATAYADQNDRDHAAFVEAIRAGRITATEG